MKGNGCGPEWMPVWLKDLLFNWFFEASCDKHDIGYTKGGNEVRRFVCDWKFIKAMMRDAKKVRFYLRPLAWITGILFFVMVRLFGWRNFNYVK